MMTNNANQDPVRKLSHSIRWGTYRHILVCIVLTAGLLTAYSQTLQSPFLFDDLGNIVDNGFIRIENLSKNTISYVWQAPHPSIRRKIPNLTFALNYLWDGYNPAGYHLVNIFIHIGCGLLAALFFTQILKIGWLAGRYGSARSYLAWGAAFLWAFHPIQINAVTYIVQRMTSLAVLFSLFAMIFWLAGRRCWEHKFYAGAGAYWLLGIGAWLLGLHCKEHVVIVPGLVMVLELFLLRRGYFRLKWRWILIGISAAVYIVFIYPGAELWTRVAASYGQRDFNLAERLMTESRVLWHYLSLFYIPVADRFTLLYDYPISRGLFSPVTTILSILSWTGVLVVTWICRKKWPVFCFMMAWFVTAHLIESTVIPLEIIFEHRMYLPSLGLALGTILMSYDFLMQHINRPKLQVSTLMAVILILGVATYTRNMDFKDAVSLYRADLTKYPSYKRLRLNLALELNRTGNFKEGGKLLEDIAAEYPTDILIQQNWHYFLASVRGNQQAAESTYQHIVQLLNQRYYRHRLDGEALWHLAKYFHDMGRYERALFLIGHLLIDFDYNSLWFYKGRCHAGSGDWASAVQAFHRAWEKDTNDPPTLYWYGKSLLQTGTHDKGCLMLKKAAQNTINEEAVNLSRKLLQDQCMTSRSR